MAFESWSVLGSERSTMSDEAEPLTTMNSDN